MSSAPFRARGDREVGLGSLGTVVCRPGLRSLEEIEAAVPSGSIKDAATLLAKTSPLRLITTVLYETHLDFAEGAKDVKTYTRAQIGAAVLEVGVGKLQEDAFRLVLSAFAPPDVVEGDQGNA